jgi:hypothetical protein
MIELFSAALCVSLRSLRYKGYFNAEIAEIRRGPQSSIPGREEMMRKLNTSRGWAAISASWARFWINTRI